MANRLVAFGCSLTYGHGLSDCYNPADNGAGNKPSETAWPNVLAEQLGIETVVNNSWPGASCKHIWKTVLDADLHATDLVIISWTYPDRWCIFSDGAVTPIGPWLAKKQPAKTYYEHFYFDEDVNLDFNLRVHHIDGYLKSKNIQCYHTRVAGKTQPWNNVNFLKADFSIIREAYPKGLDNRHPSQNAHDAFATEIYKEIA